MWGKIKTALLVLVLGAGLIAALWKGWPQSLLIVPAVLLGFAAAIAALVTVGILGLGAALNIWAKRRDIQDWYLDWRYPRVLQIVADTTRRHEAALVPRVRALLFPHPYDYDRDDWSRWWPEQRKFIDAEIVPLLSPRERRAIARPLLRERVSRMVSDLLTARMAKDRARERGAGPSGSPDGGDSR